jgi:glutathione S-transferase
VAVARFICRWLPGDHPRRAEIPRLLERGAKAFDVMEKHLGEQAFFSGGEYGIADIALYAYTHCAEEGGFDLRQWPHIGQWLARVEAQTGFSPMHSV